MKKSITTFILISFFFAIHAQQIDSFENKKNTRIQKYVIGGIVFHQAASLFLEYKWWWQGNVSRNFKIENDQFYNGYSLEVDKLGHIYTSYLYFHSLEELLHLAKFNRKTTNIVRFTLPVIWALRIETGDGFAFNGFSFIDLSANFLGIGYAALQSRYKYLQNFKIKLGYYPSNGFINNDFKQWSLSADYSGHIYWLSFDLHHLAPLKIKKYFPPFLNLAIGYGVDNYGPYANAYEPLGRKYCIGLDWNLGAIKSKNKYINTAKNIIDYIHLPAPGTKFVDGKPTENKLLLLN